VQVYQLPGFGSYARFYEVPVRLPTCPKKALYTYRWRYDIM